MAQRNYEINEAIPVKVRATPGATSVNMNVYDETDALDATQSGALTQIGSSNRWKGSFTPDTIGEWSIGITDNITTVEVPRQYSVGNYNVGSVGALVATVESKIDLLNNISSADVNSEVDSALADYDAPTKDELDIAETNIRGTDNDTLKTISDQIDSLPQTSPPMIG